MIRITAVKTVLYNLRNETVDRLPELIGEYRSNAALLEKLKSFGILPLNYVIHYSKSGYHVLKWLSKDGDTVIENTRVLYVETRNSLLQDCWLKLRLPIVMLYERGTYPLDNFPRAGYAIGPTDQHTISTAASISPNKRWGLIPVKLRGGLGTPYELRALQSKTFASSGFFGPANERLVARVFGWSPSGSSARCLAVEESPSSFAITFHRLNLKSVKVGEKHNEYMFNVVHIAKTDFWFLGVAEKSIDGVNHLCYMLQSKSSGDIRVGELTRINPSLIRLYQGRELVGDDDVNFLRNFTVL